MKKNILSFCMMYIILVSLISCSEMSEPVNPAVVNESLSNDIFVIAVLPERNVFLQKQRYRPLADYLTKAIGMQVKTKLLDSYSAVYNELLEHKVDAAIFGSLSFVVMDSKIAIEPLARPSLKNNVSTYRGSIFARKDRGITGDVRTWKGRRIALVSKSTTAGYIFPKWYLYTHGMKIFEGYFSNVIYTGSHDAAVLAVFRGEADIGSAKDSIVEKLLLDNPLMRKELEVIASSPSVPSNTIGILADHDSILKGRLKKALLGMHETPEGRDVLSALEADSYIETKKSDFDPILKMMKTINLKTDFFILGEIGQGADLDLLD
jgi:phosphonate transport system substrate-binding protein